MLCNGIDTNAEQVKLGMAWVFDRCVKDRSLYDVQNEASSNKRGLWADPAPCCHWSGESLGAAPRREWSIPMDSCAQMPSLDTHVHVP